MSVDYRGAAPDAASFKALYDTTGWGPRERPPEFYAGALAGSWACCAAWRGDELVGFARVISDGALHAFICEMIVAPAAQGQRVGAELVRRLVARCHAAGIRDIQLFCARGKEDFYRKQGFVPRPGDAPGMQYAEAPSTESGA